MRASPGWASAQVTEKSGQVSSYRGWFLNRGELPAMPAVRKGGPALDLGRRSGYGRGDPLSDTVWCGEYPDGRGRGDGGRVG
jgi:hypothetical protein